MPGSLDKKRRRKSKLQCGECDGTSQQKTKSGEGNKLIQSMITSLLGGKKRRSKSKTRASLEKKRRQRKSRSVQRSMSSRTGSLEKKRRKKK